MKFLFPLALSMMAALSAGQEQTPEERDLAATSFLNKPLSATATFQGAVAGAPIQGKVYFYQKSSTASVTIKVRLSKFVSLPSTWAIYPIPPSTKKCDVTGTPIDLTAPFGPITTAKPKATFTSTTISLYGANSIVGQSLTFTDSSGTVSCAVIRYKTPVYAARAVYPTAGTGPFHGFAHFLQLAKKPQADAKVYLTFDAETILSTPIVTIGTGSCANPGATFKDLTPFLGGSPILAAGSSFAFTIVNPPGLIVQEPKKNPNSIIGRSLIVTNGTLPGALTFCADITKVKPYGGPL